MLQQSELDWLVAERPAPIDLNPATTDRVRAELISYTERERTAPSRVLVRVPRPSLRHAAFAGATAAAAFAVLLAASLGGDQRRGAGLDGLGVQSAAAAPLVHLSAKLAAAPAPTGDATLVIRQQTNEHGVSSEAELFADDGKFYATPTLAELPAVIKASETIEGSDAEARDIASAKAALTGPTAARYPMSIAALTPGVNQQTIKPPAAVLAKIEEAKRAPGYSPPSALESENNSIWMNSMDALVAGAGDPQVRAGVLDLLATIPQITITQGTLEGQPTMVLDYSSPAPPADYHEQLIISSVTGVPIELLGGQAGQAPETTSHYKISRVTVAGVETGSYTGS